MNGTCETCKWYGDGCCWNTGGEYGEHTDLDESCCLWEKYNPETYMI